MPWKVLEPQRAPAPGPSGLAVLWFPVSRDEARGSQLLESRYLTVSIAPCSGFWIVPSDAAARLRFRYGALTAAPLALLVGADGVELARVAAEKGELRVGALERLLRGELDRRRAVAEARLDEALAKEKAGEVDAAAGLYREIYAQRCLFPGSARKAQKALKRLRQAGGRRRCRTRRSRSPTSRRSRSEEMDGAPARRAPGGVRAPHRRRAARLRAGACRRSRRSGGDAVPGRVPPPPLRRLAAGARSCSSEILARPADAVSRAVALHGLGKMTIHAGEFVRGVAHVRGVGRRVSAAAHLSQPRGLLELGGPFRQGLGVCRAGAGAGAGRPLQPDLRGDLLRRPGQDPAEARAGRAGERAGARGVVQPGGDLGAARTKEKALELLARHFYQYERFDPVRAREMQEARDDIAFARHQTRTRGADAARRRRPRTTGDAGTPLVSWSRLPTEARLTAVRQGRPGHSSGR